jgi:hypothetical protein
MDKDIIIPRTGIGKISKEDPTRFKQRVACPKKGRGRKDRPDNNRVLKEQGNSIDTVIKKTVDKGIDS